MKRRSKIDINLCIICLLFFIIILLGLYILGKINKTPTTSNQTYTQPDIVTSSYINSYDYYNFMPRHLFRNFYENDYYDYRERPVVIQDTKPIYINVPSYPTHSNQPAQPAQKNNLNLYNYPPPKNTESFQINIPNSPSIAPPPLSAVSSSSLSENTETI